MYEITLYRIQISPPLHKRSVISLKGDMYSIVRYQRPLQSPLQNTLSKAFTGEKQKVGALLILIYQLGGGESLVGKKEKSVKNKIKPVLNGLLMKNIKCPLFTLHPFIDGTRNEFRNYLQHMLGNMLRLVRMCGAHICVPGQIYSHVLQRHESCTNTKYI